MSLMGIVAGQEDGDRGGVLRIHLLQTLLHVALVYLAGGAVTPPSYQSLQHLRWVKADAVYGWVVR
jgi:hypothetical protein